MDLSNLRMLQTRLGQRALIEAAELSPQETSFLHDLTSLSRTYPVDLARAALETAILRREAKVKFPSADRMYLTREALEQASGFEISRYRGAQISRF